MWTLMYFLSLVQPSSVFGIPTRNYMCCHCFFFLSLYAFNEKLCSVNNLYFYVSFRLYRKWNVSLRFLIVIAVSCLWIQNHFNCCKWEVSLHHMSSEHTFLHVCNVQVSMKSLNSASLMHTRSFLISNSLLWHYQCQRVGSSFKDCCF